MSGAGFVERLFENSNKDKGFNFFQLMKYVKVGVPKNTMRKLFFHIDWHYSGLDTIRRRKHHNCPALLSIQKNNCQNQGVESMFRRDMTLESYWIATEFDIDEKIG
jgi:hypothetical protein